MTDFYTLWTDTGLTKLGDATLEVPFNITTAVVGDGNGVAVIPNKGQAALVNQVWSGAIGSKVRSQSDPNTIVFEFAIPAADGPFTVREVGLKSDDGQLCIVGNFPVTEKPVAADGSVRDMILRIPVHFENADVVSLVIDPNITVATKADVLAHAQKQLDPTDTDEVKEKHLSNAQAKKWDNHADDTRLHMGKNLLINGGPDIWQRGISQTGNNYGSDDRWINSSVGSTKVHTRETFALGQVDVPQNPKYFSRTVVSSVIGTGNFVVKQQRIEGVKTLSGGKAAFSFQAKADASKDIAIDFSQNFGTGGSPSTTGQGPVTTFALTTFWKKFSVILDIPSIAGKVIGTDGNDHLQVRIWFEAGSAYDAFTNSLGQQSGTFDLANIQLEAGEVATIFEQRPIVTELSLCQRYFEASEISIKYRSIVGTFYLSTEIFKVQKRIIPTIVLSDIFYTYSSGLSAEGANVYGFFLGLTNSLDTGRVGFTYSADAEL